MSVSWLSCHPSWVFFAGPSSALQPLNPGAPQPLLLLCFYLPPLPCDLITSHEVPSWAQVLQMHASILKLCPNSRLMYLTAPRSPPGDLRESQMNTCCQLLRLERFGDSPTPCPFSYLRHLINKEDSLPFPSKYIQFLTTTHIYCLEHSSSTLEVA